MKLERHPSVVLRLHIDVRSLPDMQCVSFVEGYNERTSALAPHHGKHARYTPWGSGCKAR